MTDMLRALNIKLLIMACVLVRMTCLMSAKTIVASDGSLRLPDVPVELRQPVDRADYIVAHFWDAMDWTDTEHASDTVWVEQQMVNYMSLFPYAYLDSVDVSVSRLMKAAEINPDAYGILSELAMQYLFNADSPMRSDKYYLSFLACERESPALSAGDRERAIWMYDELNKNRAGHKVADVKFSTMSGYKMNLYDINSDRDILLILYDPDCDTCHEIMADLMKNRRNVKIVALCVEGDRDTWQTDVKWWPSDWIIGYPEQAIDDKFSLLEIPSLMLLSPDLTVKATSVRVGDIK